MKSFNEIFENVCKQLIREGGMAFDNVSRIKKELIVEVVENFKKIVLYKILPENSGDDIIFLLGSTGKKKDSGDIDIGIDANQFKDSILVSLMKLDEICAEVHIASYINTISFNMLHVCWPVDEKDFVQIDVLLTKYPEFTKFYMFSPEENESRYKGAHRNMLLKSILSVVTSKIEKADENGKLLIWEQYDINESGVYREKKTLIDEKGNLLKYKNTDEPLEIEYAKAISSIPVTHDIEKTIKMTVGDFQFEDMNSFEKLFAIVSSNENFKYKEQSEEILRHVAEKLKAAEYKLEFPAELEKYI